MIPSPRGKALGCKPSIVSSILTGISAQWNRGMVSLVAVNDGMCRFESYLSSRGAILFPRCDPHQRTV